MINGIKTIGMIGGGQLGRMMIPSIKALGLAVAVLDPAPDAPCHAISDHHIVKGFDDADGFLELARRCDVITYEFEHIDVNLLHMLEQAGHTIFPSVESLRVIQDKYTQKQALEKSGIPVPEFHAIKNLDELTAYWDAMQQPFMLKSRRGGYDGKGNFVVRDAGDIAAAFAQLNRGGADDLMVEPLINFTREVSVIATRGRDGGCVIYPIADNVHKNSILDTTTVPAALSDDISAAVVDTAQKVMECFQGIGTFCTELFVNDTTGEVYVNEVAPRVHNSGHWTIEACRTSQFENHIRAILGLPLGAADMVVKCAVMKNIIGGPGQNGPAAYSGIESACSHPGVSVHIYGKSAVKPGRKMGHYTITGNTHDEVAGILGQTNIQPSVPID